MIASAECDLIRDESSLHKSGFHVLCNRAKRFVLLIIIKPLVSFIRGPLSR